MINFGTTVIIILMLGFYVFVLLGWESWCRRFLKMITYTVVFISLFFPDIENWVWRNGLGMNLRFCAIVLSGMEGIDMWTKYIFSRIIESGKELSERNKKIYESL